MMISFNIRLADSTIKKLITLYSFEPLGCLGVPGVEIPSASGNF